MNRLRFTLIIVFLFFTLSSLFAQKCGFDGIRNKQLQDPNFVQLEKVAEKRIQDAIKNRNLSKNANSDILTIPIVVHVLHLGESVGNGTNISEAQIQSSIDNLNDYYRGQVATSPVDFEIEFTLAQSDPNCNATTGINRIDASVLPGYSNFGVNVLNSNGASYNDIVALSSWPQTDYFNVWIVSELDGNNGGFGFQGYAYFYNETFNGHGSVMMSSVFGYDPGNTNGWGLNSNGDNSTVVHEVGHFFHLYHTFQGDDTDGDNISDACPADIIVGTNSDGCADTVPHQRETSTCPNNNFCTGSPWVDNNTINNIMSYYRCTDRLTSDQKIRARAAMEGTALVNSKGSEAPDPTYAAPVVACNTNSSPSNFSGIINVELNGVNYGSSAAGFDGGNIDLTAICDSYFEIDTDVTNILNISVVNVNEQQLAVYIDWNDDGDFEDDAEEQYFQEDINDLVSNLAAITLTYPVSIPYGDYVRLRLITDLDDRYSGVEDISSGCHTSIIYGQSEDYTIYIMPEPITYIYNGSWLPSNPLGVCTSRDSIEIQSGSVTIESDIECNNLIVNPGAALTIDAGFTLSTETVNLNSTSSQYSNLIVDGNITGTINYNRYTAQIGPVGTNDLISAPVVDQTFESFDSANSNLAASGNIRAFAPYNTTTGAYQNYDVNTNSSTLISSGIGYRAATTDGSSLTFTGTARSNDVLDIPISDASAGNAWNLIGNPYPSYIDFETFFNLNMGEFDTNTAFQAIYGYDGSASNGWTVWNLATIADVAITELIAPGQAFFVKSKVGGGLVDFTTEMRRAGTSDDFILGRQLIGNVALSMLNLNSSTNSSSTQIYFIDGTTKGLDVGYDAGSFTESNSEFSIFSNLVEDNMGLDMAIQTLPYDDLNDIVVPMGIHAKVGTELNISIDEISTLPSHINVYLEDTIENSMTLLNNSSYTFTTNLELNGTGRFFIRYSSVVLSTGNNELNDLLLYITSNPKSIIIKGQLSENTKAQLYDMHGRLVFDKQLDAFNSINKIDISTIAKGIYIVRVGNEEYVKAQKIVIH